LGARAAHDKKFVARCRRRVIMSPECCCAATISLGEHNSLLN
jgi:hypothetical protein